MQRFDQRQGFLVSALVHLGVLMVLASHPHLGGGAEPGPTPSADAARKVFLPPPAQLRRLLNIPPPARRPPTPAQPDKPVPLQPPPEKMKDRISIGGPSDERAKPLILRKDEEVTAAKGRPDAAPTPAPPLAPNTHQPAVQARAGDRVETPQTPGFRMPAGLGEMPRGEQGSRKGEGSQDPPIAASLRELDRRLAEAGPRGLPSGSRQMGPLAFDPEGADFTAWINHFRVEVYNNWNIPKPAELGYRGHVDFEFTVERDGTTSSVRLLKGSGTLAFDRAAQNALVGSRQLPLPADYGPPRVTMQVSFFYNEGPSGS